MFIHRKKKTHFFDETKLVNDKLTKLINMIKYIVLSRSLDHGGITEVLQILNCVYFL